MKEIQSLPASVQELMDHGKSLLARAGECEREGRLSEAESLRNQGIAALGEVTKTIAVQQPEVAGLIALAAMNREDGFDVTDHCDDEHVVYHDRYVLGIRIERTAVTTKRKGRVTRRFKMG